jgi:protocatechuate 3,4-dioxygenase, beta subunit
MLKPTTPIEDAHHHHHHPHQEERPAPTHAGLTRRNWLASSAALAGLQIVGGSSLARAQTAGLRAPTAEEIIGPFFPTRLPLDQDNDLTVIAGRSARALGQVLYLSGRVTNRKGEPVPNAELEIWQANAAGRYAHLADENPAPVDANFEGYAKIRTGADGSWRIKTIKPGSYPVTPRWSRPPHIHFDVKGSSSRLVTQMYLEGEALNEKDVLLQRSWGGKETAIARYVAPSGQPEPNALVAVWDIVLLAG